MLQCKLAGGDGSPGRWKHGTYNFPLTRGKKMIIVSASTTITTPVVVVVFVWLLLCFFGIYFALFPQCNVSVQKEFALTLRKKRFSRKKDLSGKQQHS